MNYRSIYERLVRRSIPDLRSKQDGYYERHHIVPRCMGGDDAPNNLVLLTGREHFLAHKLLRKIYPESKSLFYALLQMAIDPRDRDLRVKAREYDALRREFSEGQRGGLNPASRPEVRAKMSAARKGRPSSFLGKRLSEASKALMSEAKKGMYLGSENPMYGTLPWNTARARDEIWGRADDAYQLFLAGKLAEKISRTLAVQGSNDSSFNSMVKKFRSGWVPSEDVEWVSKFGMRCESEAIPVESVDIVRPVR